MTGCASTRRQPPGSSRLAVRRRVPLHQCRKCRTPVKTMAMPCSSAAAITSSSRIEPPGWITAVAPASTAASSPSAKGKKASEATDRAAGQRLGEAGGLRRVQRLARGDARGVDPAHLAGADADGRAVLGIDDGVGFHMLGDAEGETQVGDFAPRSARASSPPSAPAPRPPHCRATAPAGRPRPT